MKKSHIQVSASILSADFSYLHQEIRRLVAYGTDMLHLDVMDGHFVPDITFGSRVVSTIRKMTDITLDVHLMVTHPEQHIERYAEAGADSITFHVESQSNVYRTIDRIVQHKKRVGLALNPSTHHSTLEYALHRLDTVLVMTVNPGFGGQSLLRNQLQKIASVRQLIGAHQLKARIAVDGGIHPGNVKELVDAGANIIVTGSALFSHPNPEAFIQHIQGT